MKTKLEIIEETVKYYSENPRGMHEDGGCAYYAQGRMCAVGRCLIDPQNVPTDGDVLTLISCYRLDDTTFEAQLKPEYRGHSPKFWGDLQGLHDNNLHWSGNNLTELGKEELDNLKEEYKC